MRAVEPTQGLTLGIQRLGQTILGVAGADVAPDDVCGAALTVVTHKAAPGAVATECAEQRLGCVGDDIERAIRGRS